MSKKNVKKITDFSAQPVFVKKPKETPVSQQVGTIDIAEVWLTKNWKRVVAALAVITIVIVAVIIGRYVSETNAQKARHEIAAASTIPELTAILEKYKGSEASVTASMKLAKLYAAEKDYAKAYELLQTVANDEKAEPYFRIRAKIDGAGIQELQGNPDAAVRDLNQVISDLTADETQRAEAAFQAARISFQNGKKEEALQFLAAINLSRASGDVRDAYAEWASDARALQEQIKNPVKLAPAAKPAPAAKTTAK